MDRNFQDMRTVFDKSVHDTAQMNSASKDLSVATRQEAMLRVAELQGQIDGLKAMKNSIATLEFNTQEDFKSLVHQLEQQGQQEAAKTDQLTLSLDKLQTEFADRYENQQKDLAFIKDALRTTDSF